MGRQHAVIDPDIAKALAHPLRMKLLAILEERTASPTELAELTEVSLPRVSYHVRRLASAGLVELVSTRQRRGAIEHYYAAVAQDSEDNEDVPPSALALAAAARAQHAGDGRAPADGSAASRSPDGVADGAGQISLELDDRGWKHLRRRIELLREDIEHISLASRKRLEEASDDRVRRGRAIVLLVEDGAGS